MSKCFVVLKVLYFKENGKLARTMTFSDIKEMGGRTLPTKMILKPEDKKGHLTVVKYESIRFDVGLPGNFFSLSNLRK